MTDFLCDNCIKLKKDGKLVKTVIANKNGFYKGGKQEPIIILTAHGHNK